MDTGIISLLYYLGMGGTIVYFFLAGLVLFGFISFLILLISNFASSLKNQTIAR